MNNSRPKNFVKNHIIIKDARIIYKNFDGHPTKYNKPGDKNFAVIIDDEDLYNRLANEGWNIKPYINKYDENAEQLYSLGVDIVYNNYPPAVYQVTNNGKVLLDETTIVCLQHARLTKIDLDIRPRNWTDDNGNNRVKAYLDTMFCVIEESPLMDDYKDIPFGGTTLDINIPNDIPFETE